MKLVDWVKHVFGASEPSTYFVEVLVLRDFVGCDYQRKYSQISYVYQTDATSVTNALRSGIDVLRLAYPQWSWAIRIIDEPMYRNRQCELEEMFC